MFSGNRVYKIDKNGNKKQIFGFIFGLNIRFKGENSTIILHEPLPKFSKSKIKVNNNCNVEIMSSVYKISGLQIQMGSGQRCEIGKNFSTLGCEIVYEGNSNSCVKIGDECLFARNIIVRPDDGHIIYDKDTYEIKNKGKDICIGNHVWVAGNSAILKGVHIDDNCIIGHGSIVTKSSTEPNAVYAGVPAKLVRENINWTRSIEEYKNIIPDKS